MRIFRRIMLNSGLNIDIDSLPETQKIYYTATAKVTPKSGTIGTVLVNNYNNKTGQGVIGCNSEVIEIKNRAFESNNALNSIIIPNSVTSIRDYAFRNCTSLTSITIPNSVSDIDNNAFYKCTNLTNVYISDIAAWCNISFGMSESNPLANGGNLYLNNILVTDLTIPDSVTLIRNQVFDGCSALTSVTIPDSVTSIESYAFSECSSLKNVAIGNGVTSIDQDAFSDCTSLTSVTIPDSVIWIGNNAFYNCSSLTSVTISNKVTSIESSTFFRCSSLTNVTIPDNVMKIKNHAFNQCINLTSITIGHNTNLIEEFAFSGSRNLTSVYCKAGRPPSLDVNAFYNIPSDCKFYVPMGSVNAYKSATNWSTYADYIVGYDFN